MNTYPKSDQKPIRPQLTEQQLLAAFQGDVRKVRTPIIYQIGLMLATIVILALPCIYALIALALICLVAFHIVNFSNVFDVTGSLRVNLLLYITPIVAGTLVAAFMVKPFLARRPPDGEDYPLKPDEAPLLFALVKKVASIVGAPTPVRIEIGMDARAAARLERGFKGMFGNQLILYIGLPVISALTTRNLAGVIAHELGHFSQNLGMRCSYIIAEINEWFARVVYERDSWDDKLTELCSSGSLILRIVFQMSRLALWLSRFVLKVLMLLAHLVSCFVSRQMEYDADRWEAEVAGSDIYTETSRRLTLLDLASQKSWSLLWEEGVEGRYVKNYPQFVFQVARDAPDDVVKMVDDYRRNQKTRFLSTHPSEMARTANALKRNAPGVFRPAAPATILFNNFDDYATRVTSSMYRDLKPMFAQHKKYERMRGLDLL